MKQEFIIPPEKCKEGFVVRTPNWLGDLVMIFPALLQLKKILPAYCELLAICPQGLAPVLGALDIVDEVVPLRNAHAFPGRDEMASVFHRNFGAGFLFTNSLRDAIILRMNGISPLFGTDARGRAFLMKRTIKFHKHQTGMLNPPHQAKRYADIVRLAGAPAWDGEEMPRLSPHITVQEFENATNFSFNGKNVLALAPGAAYGDAKRWATENFHIVAEKWLETHGNNAHIIFLGTPQELPICESCAEHLPKDSSTVLAGKTSLTQLMFALAHATACVANDSGTMHLAAALGTPGVVPFGSTDPAATSPLSKKWTVLYQKEPCSPCFKRICPLGTKQCLQKLTAEEVFSHLP